MTETVALGEAEYMELASTGLHGVNPSAEGFPIEGPLPLSTMLRQSSCNISYDKSSSPMSNKTYIHSTSLYLGTVWRKRCRTYQRREPSWSVHQVLVLQIISGLTQDHSLISIIVNPPFFHIERGLLITFEITISAHREAEEDNSFSMEIYFRRVIEGTLVPQTIENLRIVFGPIHIIKHQKKTPPAHRAEYP